MRACAMQRICWLMSVWDLYRMLCRIWPREDGASVKRVLQYVEVKHMKCLLAGKV